MKAIVEAGSVRWFRECRCDLYNNGGGHLIPCNVLQYLENDGVLVDFAMAAES